MINNTKRLFLSSVILTSMSFATVGHAADLNAFSGSPRVNFDDTTTAADGIEWGVAGTDDYFGIYNDINDHWTLQIYPSVNSSTSLNVDSSGDIILADGAVFIDRSAVRLGIGTSTPDDDLHIKSVSPTIRLEDVDGINTWEINGDIKGAYFDIANDTTGLSMLGINSTAPNDSLILHANGVGVGTDDPTATLHVKKSGAVLIVEDTNFTAGIRTILEMKNKGPVGFKLTDTDSSDEWSFRTGGGGSFIAAKSDISGPVLSFGGDGSVSFGQNPGSVGTTSNMFLSPTGNLTIQGSLMTPLNTYADYVFASDYKLMPLDELQTFVKANKHLPNVLSEAEVKKTNMINVSELQITQLAKIEELTLYTLQQHQQIKALQVAKDSPNELVNVAITATQELQKKSDIVNLKAFKLEAQNVLLKEQLKEQGVKLNAKNDELQSRLASLEKLVINLASGQGLFPEKGNKVVLK